MNKNTKIFWGDKEVKWRNQYSRYSKFKMFLKKLFKYTLATLAVTGFIIAVYMIGAWADKTIVVKEVEVIKEVPVKAKVLDRIAKCESGGKHFDSNGQVVVNGNTNGSVDIGKYQINVRLWGKIAGDMGYNLAVEKDNEAFAQYLYQNQGTEPWVWSKKCWNK